MQLIFLTFIYSICDKFIQFLDKMTGMHVIIIVICFIVLNVKFDFNVTNFEMQLCLYICL